MVEPIPHFIMFESNRSLLSDLSRDESGQDLIEYALLAGVLALGAIAGISNLASTVSNNVNHIATAVNNIFPAAAAADH